jgi:chromosome segregation ATPase
MSSAKFKRMFNNLVLATAKQEEKEAARAQIRKQIGKIRKVSIENYPPKKDIVDREITKLEKQLEDLLEKEKIMVTAQQNEDAQIKELQSKIEALNNKLEIMSRALLSAMQAKEPTFQTIQQEPTHKAMITKNHVDILQKSLDLLEQKHEELKKSGRHSPEEIARVEEKINSLKEKLVYLS